MNPVTDRPICVTGASGFVASTLVQDLLGRGYRVRGTVRSLSKPDKYKYLTELPGAAERLELVEAELLDEGSYDKAVEGCHCVMHTASPYVIDVEDPQRDLVEPAVSGTLNVLRACTSASSVQRVVLTSSMAAISDEPVADHVFTESDWNDKSNLERNPYYYSKTQAERAAWELVGEAGTAFDLVTINPYMILGPSLSPSLNTTNQMFRDFLTGVYPGVMSLAWGFVDVRDVARAHVLAMETPSASGRYLCAGDTMTMKEIIELLKANGYDRYKLPKFDMACSVGDFTARLMSYTQPKGVGTYLRTHLGKVMRYDNSKIRTELGLQFRPAAQSILDVVGDLERWGHVESPS
jgi:dihydroflavonol-4-reductase